LTIETLRRIDGLKVLASILRILFQYSIYLFLVRYFKQKCILPAQQGFIGKRHPNSKVSSGRLDLLLPPVAAAAPWYPIPKATTSHSLLFRPAFKQENGTQIEKIVSKHILSEKRTGIL
jgi:hypothetical protein